MKNHVAILFLLFLAGGLNASFQCTITSMSTVSTAIQGQPIQFNVSKNPNDDIISYQYKCNSPTSASIMGSTMIDASYFIADCSYSQIGTYTVSASMDCLGTSPCETCSATVVVNPQVIQDNPPIVTITAPRSGDYLPRNKVVTLSGTAMDDYKVNSVQVQVCCLGGTYCSNWAGASLADAGYPATNWTYAYTTLDENYNCLVKVQATDNKTQTGTTSVSFSLVMAGSSSTVSTTTSSCVLLTSSANVLSGGSVSLNLIYDGLSSTGLPANWIGVFDCGNGTTATASCSGTKGSCSATCSYKSPGAFIVKLKDPASLTSMCGTKIVTVQALQALPNATNVTGPIITPPAPLLGCERNECEWQQQCYPEGSQNPSYNDSGNCFYGVCSGGKWLPKPEGVSCGQGSLCCAGQCRPSECINNAECASRIYEDKACYRFSCQQPGTCSASCEPEISPTNCGGAGCAKGSPEYCANLACGPHSDKLCNCGETPDDYPDECTQESAQLVFILNRTTSFPTKVVFGQPLNITVPYQSPEPLASVSCEQEGCQCVDLPDEQSILCQIYSAQEKDYTLLATDAKNRTYKTALKVTAAGVAAVIMDATPEWQRWLYLIGSIAAVGLLAGGAYAARLKMAYDSPPEEYKRVIRSVESFSGREKTLMGMYMQGKLNDRALAEQRKLLEKEERDLAARKKELEQALGPAQSEAIAKAAKDELLEQRAKAAIQKSMKESEKKPPGEGDLAGSAPYTGKF